MFVCFFIVLLPLFEVKLFATIFRELEEAIIKQELGLKSFGISMTTLEDVFLKITQQDDFRSSPHHKHSNVANNSNLNSYESVAEVEELRLSFDGMIQSPDLETECILHSLIIHMREFVFFLNLTPIISSIHYSLTALRLRPASRLRQFRTLVKKRCIGARRELLFTILFILLPSLFLVFMLVMNQVRVYRRFFFTQEK
jgi:hypothetical protein